MRFILPLCLALAACSSDPAPPVDSGLPPRDVATEIAAWIDTGTPADVADDRVAPPDFGPRDTGLDVVAVGDATVVDAMDAAVADAGADAAAVGDVTPGVSICARESDCGPRFHCFVPSGLCFECTADEHCAAGSICSNRNVCVPGCSAAHGCGDGRTCCDSVCRDLQSDPMTCGTCSTRCTGGTTCGGGRCGRADAGADAARD